MTFRRMALIAALFLAMGSFAARQSGGTSPLPPDVHPDSRSRLPLLKPGVQGLHAIRLHASGVDARWLSPLGRALTELATLISAREHDQPYEWSLHEMEALAVALEPAVIDVVRDDRPRALKIFGDRNLVDLVDLMARQVNDVTLLTAFDQR